MTANDAPALNRAAVVDALKALAAKRDITLGRMGRFDLLLVLAAASLTIPAAAMLNERDVNRALEHWLAGAGSLLRIDHVELRRTLIDRGLWQRDGFGRAYRRAERPADGDAAALLRVLADLDPSQLIADHRAALDAERARRKAAAAVARPAAVAANQGTDR